MSLNPGLMGFEDYPHLPGSLSGLFAVVLVVAETAAMGGDVGAAVLGPFANWLQVVGPRVLVGECS